MTVYFNESPTGSKRSETRLLWTEHCSVGVEKHFAKECDTSTACTQEEDNFGGLQGTDWRMVQHLSVKKSAHFDLSLKVKKLNTLTFILRITLIEKLDQSEYHLRSHLKCNLSCPKGYIDILLCIIRKPGDKKMCGVDRLRTKNATQQEKKAGNIILSII